MPASVWINTNHKISDWVTGTDDQFSWQRRLIAIPCLVQLPEEKQRDDYENRFEDEYPRIAWHCIAAYAAIHHSRTGYARSAEMLSLRDEQIGGHLVDVQEFAQNLQLDPGTWAPRSSIRAAYCKACGVPSIAKPTAERLFRAVEALPGVEPRGRSEGLGFGGVACP